MKVTWGAASPFRTNTATVILLLSVPFVVMTWLLTSAILKHEHQFSEAKQVLALFRSGLAAIDSLEEMRGLSRPANLLSPQPEVSARYDAAQKQAQQRMQQFFALTHQFARQKPSVSEPLQRLEEALPRLEDAGSGAGSSLLGPLEFISQFMDETYGILANVLYASTLPEGEKSRSAEMLLIIPDTLRQVHLELGIMNTITFPTTMNPNGLSAADITYLDEAIGNLGMLLDTLGHQLQSIKQHSGVGAANPAKLDEVRDYQDRIEKDFVLTHVQWDWERAYKDGHKAHDVINSITSSMLDSIQTSVQSAQARQREIDFASITGLLLLYAALVYFSILFFRARDAALHSREMAKELAERKRRENELRQLNQLSELLMACHSCAEAYEVFGRSAAALLAGSRGALAVPTADGEKLHTVAEWGDASRLAAIFPIHSCQALEHSLSPQTAAKESTAACEHFQSPPQGRHDCLPLVMQENVLGSLWLECDDNGLGMEECVQLATSAGETLKLALTNIKLREALHEQAIRDVLTGLYNRRYLHDIFARELAQACRTSQPIALVLIDIDHFKQVNDRYGHEAGDQALKALAEHLRYGLRASDLCFRLGGEEFVLLLHADEAGALKCVNNLRMNFHERHFTFGEHPSCQLSFSAGIVEAPLSGDRLEELLHLADTALYRAKAEGRNRVLLAMAEV